MSSSVVRPSYPTVSSIISWSVRITSSCTKSGWADGAGCQLSHRHQRPAKRRSRAGNAAALAPAITQCVVPAFEGFVEDFFATVLYRQGQSFAQIVRKMNLTNPDIANFEALVIKDSPALEKSVGIDFSVDVWAPPPISKSWWTEQSLPWHRAKQDARGWLQVRHCLAHGLAGGWRSEVWPGPIRKDAPPASSVLRAMPTGKHSLALHGAITCARI